MSDQEPDWVRHVMWWQIYPLGFTGAPVRPEAGEQTTDVVHRLGRVEAWLDHLVETGLNGLLLGPIFASSSHGYDTVDYFRVDPRLGDDGDFDRLVAAARERGIRILLDGVFNHVGWGHPAFQALVAKGPDASTADLFLVRDWSGWEPGKPVPAEVFEGHGDLMTLDHDAPAVADLVVDVMNHWLDRGIDGWRLDAAYALPPAFWSRVLPRVREAHPDAWFVGEVIQGDYPAIVAESTMDSLTQYELWQGIWHGISDGNFYELQHALGRHDDLLSAFVPLTFVGNHDVTRIASAVGVELVPHAVAVLFTVAGTPSVYAGDEFGFPGVKEDRVGGDDAVRPKFADHPPKPDELDVQAHTLYGIHRDLIALRRQRPWLHDAHSDVVDLTNQTIVLRTATAEGVVLAALNIGDEPAALPAADATTIAAGNGTLTDGQVQLPAHGWAVLTG